jgi:hypothetical protein
MRRRANRIEAKRVRGSKIRVARKREEGILYQRITRPDRVRLCNFASPDIIIHRIDLSLRVVV